MTPWPCLGPALVTLVNLHYTIPDVGLQDIRLEEGSSVLAPDKSLVIEIMADQHHAMLSLFITLSLGSVDEMCLTAQLRQSIAVRVKHLRSLQVN